MKVEVFGADNPATLMTLARLAKVERQLGRHDSARARLLGGIEIGLASNPDHAMVVELRLVLAELEIEAGDFAAADVQLDDVEAQIAGSEEDVSWYVAEVKLLRAQSHHRRGRDREARALIGQAEALLTETDDPALVQRVAALRAELEG